MENVTRTLSGFAARLAYPELPPALIERLKTCLLDAIGCGLHGAGLPWADIVNRWVMRQGGPPEATLWRQGFRGPVQILEAADGGFCRATSDAVDLTLAIDRLGKRFHAAEVNIKPYACCASSHSAVDAVLDLKREHGVAAAEADQVIERIARLDTMDVIGDLTRLLA